MTKGPKLMRWVVGYEGLYLVHRDGYVVNRRGDRMAVAIDRYGYAGVRLSRDGKQRHHKVHRLICEAFNGTPTAEHCAHADGDKLNNRPENLRWSTRSENIADSIRHGTFRFATAAQSGERHPRAKLTKARVREIREKAAMGQSGRSIARELGMNQPHIAAIIRRDKWKCVE